MKLTAYMRKAYTYNIQLQRTQQTAHNACSVCHIVNISVTAESGYNCFETNTMSQARRPFTLENLWFHNILPTKGLLTVVPQLGASGRSDDASSAATVVAMVEYYECSPFLPTEQWSADLRTSDQALTLASREHIPE